jgi:hypothetical protein
MMGFASKDQMETFNQIADPNTSKQARKAMIAALAFLSESESVKEPEPKKFRQVFFTYKMQEDSPPSPGHSTPAPLTHYHSILANCFARFAFPISDSLPFINVPIGRVIAETGHPQDYLCGLADTGGCCTMAWKRYMLRLKEKFLEYIKEHTVLKKERQFQDIKIGGIQGGVFITDVLTLYLGCPSHQTARTTASCLDSPMIFQSMSCMVCLSCFKHRSPLICGCPDCLILIAWHLLQTYVAIPQKIGHHYNRSQNGTEQRIRRKGG